MKTPYSGFLLAMLVLLAVAPNAAAAQDIGLTAEDYSVYSAVIQTHFVGRHTKMIVIKDHAPAELPHVLWGLTPVDGQELIKLKAATSHATWKDYESKNKQVLTLEKRFKLTLPYELFNEKDQTTLFETKDRYFRAFYGKYPGSQGIMVLSRVGFNPARDQALVYVANLCGTLCGSGAFFLLKRQKEVWTIEYTALLWLS